MKNEDILKQIKKDINELSNTHFKLNANDMNIIYRFPDKKEIYNYIRNILIEKKYNGNINSKQYKTLLGFARRNNIEICKNNLKSWFIKYDNNAWKDIENYINTESPYLKTIITVQFSEPVQSTIIDINLIDK